MPSTDALETRSTPVQRRAQERVDALLDAAAGIIAASGIAALTTSAVADRSGSSVGVVYRYFPNADAILAALGQRNRERYGSGLEARLAAGEAPDWRGFVRAATETYAEISRNEPAFTRVRFGDIALLRYGPAAERAPRRVGGGIVEALVDRYGFQRTPELEFAAELAMECADAIIARAFLDDPAGDERFIAAAERMLLVALVEHSPGGARVVIPD